MDIQSLKSIDIWINRIGKCNIVCTPHETRLSLIPDALHLKAHYPERVYVFGGLDISALFTQPESCGVYFADYVDKLIEMGCDGVKMLEGKPDMRKRLPIPAFDSQAYAPYWEKMEQVGMPIVFHVNDPEEFWDAKRVPEWAKQQGWFYGDGSYINNETQYTEVLEVMKRHPGVKVIFAHFFFLSNQLARLAGYLDEFPNMHVDLTHGIEMYHNFSNKPNEVRDFFMKYQDRILYGTDVGAKALLAKKGEVIEPVESKMRVDLVRGFLEEEGNFQLETEKVNLFGKFAGGFEGINLPADVLKKIYYQNFERLAGNKPRPINPERIAQECQRLKGVIPIIGTAQPGQVGDTTIADMVMAYFGGRIN
jgi:predicted TIM-barrel fold metal-dependent hydrolase